MLEFGFPPAVTEAVLRWLEHKREIRKTYKPTGLNAVLKLVKKNCGQYGERAVADVIDASIAAGYQGITWDKLSRWPTIDRADPLEGVEGL